MNVVSNILISLLKIVTMILYVVFSAFFTVIIAAMAFDVIIEGQLDFQIIFYLICSTLIILGLWFPIFVKISFLKKLALLIFFGCYFLFYIISPLL